MTNQRKPAARLLGTPSCKVTRQLRSATRLRLRSDHCVLISWRSLVPYNHKSRNVATWKLNRKSESLHPGTEGAWRSSPRAASEQGLLLWTRHSKSILTLQFPRTQGRRSMLWSRFWTPSCFEPIKISCSTPPHPPLCTSSSRPASLQKSTRLLADTLPHCSQPGRGIWGPPAYSCWPGLTRC